MAHRSLFRAGDPATDGSEHEPTQRMPTARPPADGPEPSLAVPGDPTPRRLARRIGVALIAVTCVALAATLAWSFVRAEQLRDDHRREVRELRVDHARRMADVRAEAAEQERRAVAAAVADQKRVDARRLRRAVAAERRKADRRVEAARAAGYSAGNVDGYSQGSVDGYDQGLYEGSDSLDCSDDPDIVWLPYCW